MSGNSTTDDGHAWDADMAMDAVWFLQDVCIVLGNFIIGVLLFRENKGKCNSVNMLLLNQTLTDGSLGVLGVAFLIHDQLAVKNTHNTNVITTMFRVVISGLFAESLQTLGTVSFSLYLAICHPFKYKRYNKVSIIGFFIVSSWGFNIFVCCLIFAADDVYINDDYMLFSFYRMLCNQMWYDIIKIVAMVIPSLITVVCFMRTWIYGRKLIQDDVTEQSSTRKRLRQSLGVLWLHALYGVAFFVHVIQGTYFPVTSVSKRTGIYFLISVIFYQYLALKLPIFLLVFKPYRRLARRVFCPCIVKEGVRRSSRASSSRSSRTTGRHNR